jgi:predicted membrane-bound spermidine synthase
MEIAMLHKFGLFLGHPGYALPVVITGMLLASGGGSLISHSVCDRFGIGAVAGLVIGLLLLGTLTMDAVLTFFVAEVNAVRLLIGAVYLFIIGFPLGMMFPIGMRLASARSGGNMLAWFWGINGVMSVVATIAEVIIVQAWGISVVFVLVIFLYVIACASLIWQSRRARSGSY